MRQTAIALALLLLFAFPCYGAEQEAAEYIGFSQAAESFPFLSDWPSAPDPVVRKALPLASEVHLTCTAPRAFAVRFGFYASSPLFCSPTRQGDALIPGVSRDSCAVLGSYLDVGQCLPLRYSPHSDSLWAEYRGSWYQLCWNFRMFQYEMQRQETGPLPEGLCQGLVQLSVSQDGERFTETEYRIVDIKSQSLEGGKGDLCYYLCEATLPAQTGFVRISVKDCRSYPLSGGGSQANTNPNAVYLGQVAIECEKAPEEEEKPGGEEEPGGETKPGEEGEPDDREPPGGEENPGEAENPDDGQDPTAPEPPGDKEDPGGDKQPDGEGKPGGEDKPGSTDPENPGSSAPDDTPPAPPDSGETPVTPAPPEEPSAPGRPDIPSPGPTQPWKPENPEEEPLPAPETPKSLRLRRETAEKAAQETEAPVEHQLPPAAPSLSASLQEPAPVQSEPQAVQDQIIIEYRERPIEGRSGEQSSASPQSADMTPAGYSGGNHIFYQKASGSSGMSVSSVLLAAGLGVQLHVVASRLASRRREDAPAASDREPPEQ